MKVLLINNNPVVGKLVTLSAQKTGDELSSVHSIDEVTAGEYDFVLMDDAGYSDDLLDELRTKAEFSKSCFIGSRSTEKPTGFTHEIKKPFLPTDLVDIFIKISSDTKSLKTEDEGTQINEEVLSDKGLETSAGMTDDLGTLDDALPNAADEVIDLEDLDALDSLDEVFEHDLESEELNDELALDDLNETSEGTVDETLVADEIDHQSVLDDEDVKEVQDLLVETEEEFPDELDESLLEDDTQAAGSTFADEATLDEINNALEEIDEDEEAVSLDDALDAFKEEEESVETLGNIDLSDLSDLEEEFDSTEDDNIADLGANDQVDSDDDLGDLLDELDLEEEGGAEEDVSEEPLADEGTDLLDEMLSDDDLLAGLDLSEEDISEEGALEGLADDEVLSAEEETNISGDDILDEAEESEISVDLDEQGLDESGLSEETADEESFTEDLDEESDLLDETDLLEEMDTEEDEAAIAEETNLEELLAEDAVSDEEDLEALLSEAEDDYSDESDLLDEKISQEDESIADEEVLDELSIEEPDLSDEMLSEESEDEDVSVAEEESEDTNEIDLSALNDEIEEALSELDEDDLMSEIEEDDISSLEDELASLNAADLKIALGEANDEDSEIQEEIEALESSIETEEELGLSVGQSEFASLNKEALSEARGEGLLDDNDHPELEEVNAFVDEVAVEGASTFDMSSKTSADESIVTLENLISTLKQGDVKEALKGMEMNIKISFSEKSE